MLVSKFKPCRSKVFTKSYLRCSFHKLWQILVLGFDVDVQVRFEALADETIEGRQVWLEVDLRVAFRRFRVGVFEERVFVVFGDRFVERIRRVRGLGFTNRFLVLKINIKIVRLIKQSWLFCGTKYARLVVGKCLSHKINLRTSRALICLKRILKHLLNSETKISKS